MSAGEKGTRFWIAIIAAFVTAVVAAVIGGVIQNTGWPNNRAKPAEPTGEATEEGTVAPSSSSSSKPAKSQVRWKGKIQLTTEYTDLDVVPPESAADYDDNVDVHIGPYPLNVRVGGKSQRWTEQSDPSENDCANLLRTGGYTDHEYEGTQGPGRRFCLTTSADRIAFIRFVDPIKSDDSAYYAKVHVTVWRNADG